MIIDHLKADYDFRLSIVAVSAELFDNWPTWNGLNPNDNPICGLHLKINCMSRIIRCLLGVS